MEAARDPHDGRRGGGRFHPCNPAGADPGGDAHDELFFRQQQALNPDERRQIIWQLAEVLCEEALHVPLYEQRSINALAKGLAGVSFNPEWSMYLHKAAMG